MKSFHRAVVATALVLAGASIGCSNIAPPDKGDETIAPACADDLRFFESRVWGPILNVQCIGCHSASGPASGTAFVLETPDIPDHLQHNWATAAHVAGRTTGGTSVLLLRPSGKHPEGHRGGALIAPESPEYGDLQAFVGRVTKGECQAGAIGTVQCTGAAPGRRVLRRLTRDEFDHTITDLFGMPSRWGQAFVADIVKNGFDNDTASLVVSPLLADQIRKAAEDIADQALTKISSLVTCTPDPPGVDTCARTFVTSFGKRAFRRPLTAAETGRYVALHGSIAAEDGFAEGVRYVLTAMLQSSSFLYRLELGDLGPDNTYHLGPYEVASELAYLIWGTMPDDELLRAADSGALARPDEVERQARRLLAGSRSTKTFGRFAEAWLGLGVFPNVVKDEALFPDFTDAIRGAMLEEVTGFVDHVRRAGTGALPELHGHVRCPITRACGVLRCLVVGRRRDIPGPKPRRSLVARRSPVHLLVCDPHVAHPPRKVRTRATPLSKAVPAACDLDGAARRVRPEPADPRAVRGACGQRTVQELPPLDRSRGFRLRALRSGRALSRNGGRQSHRCPR
jgi:hypothetical protein